jgi:hypothetical protein
MEQNDPWDEISALESARKALAEQTPEEMLDALVKDGSVERFDEWWILVDVEVSDMTRFAVLDVLSEDNLIKPIGEFDLDDDASWMVWRLTEKGRRLSKKGHRPAEVG